jgi:hypothetical protein
VKHVLHAALIEAYPPAPKVLHFVVLSFMKFNSASERGNETLPLQATLAVV